MGILHPVAASIPYALVTGAFLGYCYAHFAAKSTSAAVFATAAFHGAINLVGWTMLMVP
jgi:FtsH-binding integral membrane protein